MLDEKGCTTYINYLNSVNTLMKKLAVSTTDGITYLFNGKTKFKTINDDNMISYDAEIEFKPSASRKKVLDEINEGYSNDETYYIMQTNEFFEVFKERKTDPVISIDMNDDGLYFTHLTGKVSSFQCYIPLSDKKVLNYSPDNLVCKSSITNIDVLKSITNLNSRSTIRLVIQPDEVKVENDFLSLDYNVYSIPVMKNTILNVYVKELKSGIKTPDISFEVYPMNDVEDIFILKVINTDKDMHIKQTFIITR